jgi:molybdopterin-containing oxidoreductase family membrane subunit
MVVCNVLVPHLFWFARIRHAFTAVFIISLLINVGMWFERFIIIVSSLEREFLPSRWTSYQPTSIEISTLIGSFGLFFTCFLLFCRFVPVIAMAEIKGVLTRPDSAGGTSAPASAAGVRMFDREEDLLHATAVARHEGLHIVDAFSPYAVHHLDRAIGRPATRLPWVCFLLGLTGAVTMLLFQFWTTAISWPINVGGKPWNSWPAFVPITFEMMVLCAGVGTVVAFVWRSGLRPGPALPSPDRRVTDDRFALVVRERGGA